MEWKIEIENHVDFDFVDVTSRFKNELRNFTFFDNWQKFS